MFYRRPTLMAAKTGLTTGTELIDINVKDPISRIQIHVYGTNGDDEPDGHPASLIKGIEIVDGSEIIASLEGKQAQAVDFYDNKNLAYNVLSYNNGQIGRAVINLNFGRWLYDEVLALDPTHFRNLQLRITYDNTLGLSSLTSMAFRVFADMFDEKTISPVGYLLTKEEYKFTPASGSVEYIELPADMPIRKLVLISPAGVVGVGDQVGDIILDEDNGKRVLFNESGYDIGRWYRNFYPAIIEWLQGVAVTGAQNYYSTAGHNVGVGIAHSTSTDVGIWITIGTGLRRIIRTSAGDLGFQATVVGDCPHGSLPLPFGKQEDIEDWWDVTRIGEARLQLKPTALVDTGTDVSVLTQRLSRY